MECSVLPGTHHRLSFLHHEAEVQKRGLSTRPLAHLVWGIELEATLSNPKASRASVRSESSS